VAFEAGYAPAPAAPPLGRVESIRPSTVIESLGPVLEVGRNRPRLIIADDDPVVLAMLECSLSYAFDVVGVASDAEEVVELAGTHRPDAALVDLEMPKGGGMTAVRAIVEVSPGTAIVVLSVDESDRMVRELMQAGAIAYRRKGIAQPPLAALLTGAIAVMSKPSPDCWRRLPEPSSGVGDRGRTLVWIAC
jgi:CheY-like chemotaxis protein